MPDLEPRVQRDKTCTMSSNLNRKWDPNQIKGMTKPKSRPITILNVLEFTLNQCWVQLGQSFDDDINKERPHVCYDAFFMCGST